MRFFRFLLIPIVLLPSAVKCQDTARTCLPAFFLASSARTIYRKIKITHVNVFFSPDITYRFVKYNHLTQGAVWSSPYFGGQGNNPLMGITAGIGFTSTISKKITWETGLVYTQRGYLERTEYEYRYPRGPSSGPTGMTKEDSIFYSTYISYFGYGTEGSEYYKYEFIELPVKIRYSIYENKKWALRGVMGISLAELTRISYKNIETLSKGTKIETSRVLFPEETSYLKHLFSSTPSQSILVNGLPVKKLPRYYHYINGLAGIEFTRTICSGIEIVLQPEYRYYFWSTFDTHKFDQTVKLHLYAMGVLLKINYKI